jgi:hypothetical protein
VSNFARVEYAPIFHNLRHDIERLRDDILAEGGRILKRETQRSIRERWYRSGTTLRSLEEDVVVDGDRKTYQLTPTATSKKGAPYPLFGEYGTGQRGRATGGPAPAGYRYGSKPGMTARRFGRLAIDATKPQLIRVAQEELARYARNQTVD